MKHRNMRFVNLINYSMMQLTMGVPVGKEMYTVLEKGTEHETGSSIDFVKVTWQDKEYTHYFHGPTLAGLGPAVAKAERERLLLLRQQVDTALSEVEGFIEFFEKRDA